jgi:hypothetical protein
MKVYIGYYVSYDFCDTFKTVEKVFDDEVKALLWVEDNDFVKNVHKWTDGTELEWRAYEEMELE